MRCFDVMFGFSNPNIFLSNSGEKVSFVELCNISMYFHTLIHVSAAAFCASFLAESSSTKNLRSQTGLGELDFEASTQAIESCTESSKRRA